MNRPLKFILRRFLGDYEIYNIYCCASPFESPDRPVEMAEISAELCRQSPYPEIQDLAGYAGRDAKGFGLFDKAEVCLNQAKIAGFRLVGGKWGPSCRVCSSSCWLMPPSQHLGRMGLGTCVKWEMSVQNNNFIAGAKVCWDD